MEMEQQNDMGKLFFSEGKKMKKLKHTEKKTWGGGRG